jgi:hypothetical protein
VIVSLEQGEYGAKQIIILFSAVSVEGKDSIILNFEREVLGEAPAYTGSEVNDAAFFEGVYRSTG